MAQQGMTVLTEEVQRQVRALLADADAVLVGAGWGLSQSAGAPLDDALLSERFRPLAQAGFHTYGEVEERLARDDARYWGYWFRRIRTLRFDFPRSAVYDDVLRLVGERDYFVLTSTVDGLFYKSKADPNRVYTPQGDYARLQCAANCSGETVSVLPQLKRALGHIDEQTLILPEAYVPRCSRCGGPMTVNVRGAGDGFCAKPYAGQAAMLRAFLQKHDADRLVLLEIGVGYSQPNLIRFPFEQLTASHPHAALVRINTRHPLCSAEIRDRAVCIGMDAKAALAAL